MDGLKRELCYKKSRVLASARMPPLLITLTINLSLLESPWTDPSEALVSYKGRYEHQSFELTMIIAILLTKPVLLTQMTNHPITRPKKHNNPK